jgi:beta-lactamase regulating signal transducer with metallopeptidase domain
MAGSLTYLLRSALYLTVFYTFFLLVLRRSSAFRFNRFALLGGTVVCLLLPLLHVTVDGPTLYSELTGRLTASAGLASAETAASTGVSEMSAKNSIGAFSWLHIPLLLYVTGAVTVLFVEAKSYLRMFRLLRRTPYELHDGCRLYLLERDIPSFSWMHNILMSRSDYENLPAILAHELAHVRCGHSWDLLFFGALSILQWFNPLVWICQGELKLLHEYEADDAVLKQGIDGVQYQKLLIRKAIGETQFRQANGFNHAQLKLRIRQMRRPATPVWQRALLLLVLPLLGGTTLLMADQSRPMLIHDGVEFTQWLYQEVRYPKECRDAGLEGRIVLDFKVDENGILLEPKLLGTTHPALEKEILRAMQASPHWIPMERDGKNVPILYTCYLDINPEHYEKR